MSISKPTPRIAESFIGNSNKPTWKQLKCIYAINKGVAFVKPQTREQASQMIQNPKLILNLKSKLGKGKSAFQLVTDLADLKSEVNSEKATKTPAKKSVVKTPATKLNRATLKQKMCIYAISMKLWNDVAKAKDLSNLAKSRDEASHTIAELMRLQN